MTSNINASAKQENNELVVTYETEDSSSGSCCFGSTNPNPTVTRRPAPGGEVLDFTTRNGHKHTSGVFPANILGKGKPKIRMRGDNVQATIPLGGTSGNAAEYF